MRSSGSSNIEYKGKTVNFSWTAERGLLTVHGPIGMTKSAQLSGMTASVLASMLARELCEQAEKDRML